MAGKYFVFPLFLVLIGCISEKSKFIDENLNFAQHQTRNMLNVATDLTLYPRTTAKDGKLKMTNMYDWTSGFFAGNLWYLYEYTGDRYWKEEATRWTESLEPLKNFRDHHDLGFMMYCSYGNAYRLTGNKKYRDILIKAAESLSSRYSPATQTIKSWNYRKSWDGNSEWFYPVIIDNMMNLELLFYAYKETGNEMFREVAINHTEKTLENHFRPDFGTYHVINYDTVSGAVLNSATMQGYADESTWARGQAWAIYGFTMVYRETGNLKYLNAATSAADFYLQHKSIPSDLIPYWDFDIKDPAYSPDWKYTGETKLDLRDASAAAITASALFELSQYECPNNSLYFESAEKILRNLTANHRGEKDNNNHFILKNSVGSFPHNEELDVPLVYADYYFLEALLRYKKLSMKQKPVATNNRM
jgi:unsaturated chondroitin disaccharide hydrolase